MATASVTAIVPLRTGGKTRLAPVLAPSERAALAAAMLADVASALHAAGVARVVVAAQGPPAVTAGHALGLEVLRDASEGGLDQALRHAATRVGGSEGLLVAAADLPRLTAADVEQVLASPAAVVVAPTRDAGTGGLLRRPPGAIPTAYGPGSARAHLRLAADAGLRAEVVRAPGFAHDVDTLADLEQLPGGELGAATARVLAELGLPRRAAG